jgi:hypothetical protein
MVARRRADILRKALILVAAVAVAAAYAWLRPSAPTPYPPFVGTEASACEVKVRVVHGISMTSGGGKNPN